MRVVSECIVKKKLKQQKDSNQLEGLEIVFQKSNVLTSDERIRIKRTGEERGSRTRATSGRALGMQKK